MILVTGTTGLVGQALCEVLAQGRVAVRLATRRTGLREPGPGFEFAAVDLASRDSVRALVSGVRRVIHLAGTPPGMPPAGRQAESRAAALLVEECERAGVERFTYLSATGADARASFEWLREKGRSEDCLRGSGMEWVILRAGLVYSPTDRVVNALAAAVRSGARLRLPAFCHGMLRPISAPDLGIALATSLDHYRMTRQVVEIGEEQAFTLRQIVVEIARRLGRSAEFSRAPWRGRGLGRVLSELPEGGLPDAPSLMRWFSVAQPPPVDVYERLLSMKRWSFLEELRGYPWGPPPPRPGDPLPVLQQPLTGLPPFIPGAHLRDEDGAGTVTDPAALGRVDPFGRPEAGPLPPADDAAK